MEADNLIIILQAALGPFVLISGSGLLLLVMTNRIGRPIDRIRLLCHEAKQSSGEQGDSLRKQIQVLYQRCRLLQLSIACITISILLASLIVFILFAMFTFEVNLGGWVRILFVLSLTSLMISLLLFLKDISITLKSIRIEIEEGPSH